jgi:hypothetical protein
MCDSHPPFRRAAVRNLENRKLLYAYRHDLADL